MRASRAAPAEIRRRRRANSAVRQGTSRAAPGSARARRAGSSSAKPRQAASARAATSSATATSPGVRSKVMRPGGPESDSGDSRAELLPQFAGSQRGVEFAARPAGHPDQAEVADGRAAGLDFAFELDDLVAAATASRACAVPRMPPPMIVTRIAVEPFRSPQYGPTSGCCGAEQQVNNWYRPISGTLITCTRSTKSVRYCDSLRGVWDEESVDELDHALQSAARAIDDGADDELVLAAALHDLAHSPLFGDVAAARHDQVAHGLADAPVRRAGGLAGWRARRRQAVPGRDRPGLRDDAVRRRRSISLHAPGRRRRRRRVRRRTRGGPTRCGCVATTTRPRIREPSARQSTMC